MVEMVETREHSCAQHGAELDHFGRDWSCTSTYDGIAIARAIIEHIHNHPQLGAKTLFATHYHELIELEQYLPRVRNYNVAVLEQASGTGGRGRVVFMHKIVRWRAPTSHMVSTSRSSLVSPGGGSQGGRRCYKTWKVGKWWMGVRLEREYSMPLFAPTDPLRQELSALVVLSLSPLEALNKLFELAEKASVTNR